ncbi:MAG: hypothetical protein DRI57_24680 [Deltaproteobacteria bacterium]|nr:MAG: hypothetical protein DRI57_24680 [Deltaproteobacteria bacterium]
MREHQRSSAVCRNQSYATTKSVRTRYIDLGAEKLIAAQKDETKIAVEIKSFSAPSVVSEFHAALGVTARH